MEEENDHKQELKAPPRFFRYGGFKFLTISLLLLTLFVILGHSGLLAVSSSKFCASCHEMKPEYYTWKASAHNEVDCVNCHTDPVFKNLAKDKVQGVIAILKNNTSAVASAAPIVATKEVPNSACEKCHNMKTRQVTPAGDIIIPHEKHLAKGIECVQCHSGVAHGNIADKKMTYQTDLNKWNQAVGTEAMADLKFSRPDMDTCMECHKARNISTACKTCHSTGMEPKSHKAPDFATKTHGILAGKELQKCNECHHYMSSKPLTGFEGGTVLDKYLNQDSQTKNQTDYAKENTFCLKCHGKRPASHVKGFINIHGNLAEQDQSKCLACHDLKKKSSHDGNAVACSSCHSNYHNNPNWRVNHPIQLPENPRPNETCYTCHPKATCTGCHRN